MSTVGKVGLSKALPAKTWHKSREVFAHDNYDTVFKLGLSLHIKPELQFGKENHQSK